MVVPDSASSKSADPAIASQTSRLKAVPQLLILAARGEQKNFAGICLCPPLWQANCIGFIMPCSDIGRCKGRFILSLIFSSALVLFLQLPVHANQSVTLSWNPNSDPSVVGYRVYYGTASRAYTNSVDVGNVTTATLAMPSAGTTYHFAATCYDGFGDESDFSNETILSTPATPPPGVVAVAAATVTVVTNPATLAALPRVAGQFGVKLSGASNQVYIVQASTNLVDWSPVATNAAPFNFVATNANLPRQFFRAVGAAVTTPAAGVLTAATRLPGRQFSFTVSGSSNAQYVVQASTDLVNWVPLATNAVPFVFVDTNANLPQRFYRATGAVTFAVPAAVAVAPAAPVMKPLGLPGGQFGFSVSGTPGSQYVVQASTNLVNWVSVQTNAVPFAFVDTNVASFRQRFFRAFALSP